MAEDPSRGAASWEHAAGLLPLVARQAPSLVLFRAVHDAGVTELDVSGSIERLTGYPPDEFGRNPELLVRLVVEGDRPVMRELLSPKGDLSRTRVVGIRRRGGDRASVVVQALGEPDAEGGVRIHGAIRDVSGWSVEEEMPPDLSILLHDLDDAVLYVDTNRRIRFFNRGAEELLGWSADEVLGEHPGELFWLGRDGEQKEAFGERAFAGESFVEEVQVRTKGGERRWCRVSSNPVRDAGGELRGVLGISRDVTGERTRRMEQERLSELVASSPAVIFTAEPRAEEGFATTFITDNVREVTGHSPDAFLGEAKFWAAHLHPDDRSRVFEEISRLFDDGRALTEYRFRCADGAYRWIRDEMRLHREVGKKAGAIVGSMMDITEQKRAEEAARRARDDLEKTVLERTAELRDSERRFREMVEHAPLGIARTSPDGRILTANRVFARILGYDEADSVMEDVRLPDDVYVDPSDRERILTSLEEKGDVRDEDVRWRRKDGGVIWIRIDAVLEPADEEGDEHFLAFVQDITSERSLEEQLLHSQKMEAVGTLAGGVAHDFNNLLTPILTNAELALQALDSEHPVREDLEDIRSAAQRAAELTGQILSFSRKDAFEARLVDVAEVVAGMERMLVRTLPDDVRIDLHLPDEPCRTRADPKQLEQVVMNLAVNARDAMPEGGRLTLEVRRVELDEAYAGLRVDLDPGSYLLLEVSDSGVGMDPETRSRIFEPFYTTKDVGEGTGLGLSTVYAIVQRCGGQVGVYSEPGEGTVFRVYLPRVGEEGQPVDPPREAGTAMVETGSDSPAATTLLLVEDDDRVRRSAVRVLRGAGYEVVEAADGEEALALFQGRDEPVDLLLTDVIMPEMDGVELAERCRELAPELGVLFMSGYTERSLHRRSSLDAEISFLQKPFTPTKLRKKVRKVLAS